MFTFNSFIPSLITEYLSGLIRERLKGTELSLESETEIEIDTDNTTFISLTPDSDFLGPEILGISVTLRIKKDGETEAERLYISYSLSGGEETENGNEIYTRVNIESERSYSLSFPSPLPLSFVTDRGKEIYSFLTGDGFEKEGKIVTYNPFRIG